MKKEISDKNHHYFEVAMQHRAFVQVRDTGRNISQDFGAAKHRKWFGVVMQQVVQAATLHNFHYLQKSRNRMRFNSKMRRNSS
jgi:hypothetical protein